MAWTNLFKKNITNVKSIEVDELTQQDIDKLFAFVLAAKRSHNDNMAPIVLIKVDSINGV